jgi:hypothetical protein
VKGYQNRLYQSPADPSYSFPPLYSQYGYPLTHAVGDVSYAANYQVFRQGANMNSTFADGFSNTITWTTHYAQCYADGFDLSYTAAPIVGYTQMPPGDDPNTFDPKFWFAPFGRRPTFADPYSGDTVPASTVVPNGVGGYSQFRPSNRRHATMFQLAPSQTECNPYVPNSPYREGLLVAMADGSVRFLSGTMSESTFWAAVTPAGGEVLGNDW